MQDKNAHYLIANNAAFADMQVSSWDYDNRYASKETFEPKRSVCNSGKDDFVTLRRRFELQNSGKVVLDMKFAVSGVTSGVYMSVNDELGKEHFVMYSDKCEFYFKGQNVVKAGSACDGTHLLKMIIDMDSKEIVFSFDGEDAKSFLGVCDNIACLTFGTIKGYPNERFFPFYVEMYRNYLVNELYMTTPLGKTPFDWETVGNMGVVDIENVRPYTSNDMRIDGRKGEKYLAKKTFEKSDKSFIFETYVLLPKGNDGYCAGVYSGDKEVISLTSKNNAFVLSDGTEVRKFTSNVWQWLRIEGDRETNKARIVIDGSDRGYFDMNDADFIDNIKISYDCKTDGEILFTETKYSEYTHPEDYCPEPKPVTNDEYNIGMNTCSLWRDGSGNEQCWDVIAPYPYIEPVIGFYDEGTTEVADWEIKFMVEHGVKFQHFCWFNCVWSPQNPIRLPAGTGAIHAMLASKYSPMFKFMFMYETTFGTLDSAEQFKNIVWPYWKEYYFSNEKYFTVDNQAMITLYGNSFYKGATEEETKELIEFIKEDIKSTGLDGIIVGFADGHQRHAAPFEAMARRGGDFTYGYHWNPMGKHPEHQKIRMEIHKEIDCIHTIPTLAAGFNNVGWTGFSKGGLITKEGMKDVARYIKNDYLALYKNEKESWKYNTVMVANWNEYGEGHYVMPTTYAGFDFLDAIREEFCFAESDGSENLMPTENQKARLCHLFPKDRSIIKPFRLEEETHLPTKVLKKWDFSDVATAREWTHTNDIIDYDCEHGALSGYRNAGDGDIELGVKCDVDVTNCKYLHLRMKLSAGNHLLVGYITDATDGKQFFHEAACKDCPASEDYIDFYIDMKATGKWTGRLTELFIRPTYVNRASFAIESVELLEYEEDDKPISVVINDNTEILDFDPILCDNEVYIAFNPQYGILRHLGTYYEYSKFSGRFMLARRDREIVFTVGKKLCTVNGITHTLKDYITLRDGLPVIPLGFVAKQLGFSFEFDGKTALIK